MQSGAQQGLKQRERLKQLIEIYALRTRRLSEVIAVLGAGVAAHRQIDETLVEVKKLRRLAEQSGADLFAFVGQPPEESAKE